MTTNEIIFEVLQSTGLNWNVNKETLTTESGIVVPNKFATVRSDNSGVLGIVGDRYEILQNSDMAHTIYEAGAEVFDKDLNVSHPWNNAQTLGGFGNFGGGSLRSGEKVFLQLQLPEAYIGKSGVKRFITITNSHDGSSSLGFGTTNQVVCCENTFAMAHKTLSKIRHTASMQERVDESVDNIRKMLGFEEKQMEIFNEASNRSFDRQHIQDIVKAVFGKDINSKQKEIATRTQNQMLVLSNDISTSIDEQGETLWALFNGVTRYTNHSRVSRDKDYSLMFGADARINEQAYRTMLGWLKVDEKDLITV